MVRSDDGHAIVLGGSGARDLEDDSVTGEDPLRHFGANAADHLRRTDSFPHCPDILVNCAFDPERNEVAPFEEFMGSHGALGGWQITRSPLSPRSGAGSRRRSSGSRRCTASCGDGSPRPGSTSAPTGTGVEPLRGYRQPGEMKVLYGVNGEGMGHATRSEVVIDSLLERHQVGSSPPAPPSAT